MRSVLKVGLIALCGLCVAAPYTVAQGVVEVNGTGEGAGVETERDALKMLRRGEALMEDRQEERAVKIMEGVMLNFPRALVRHQAALALGRFHIDKHEYPLAIKTLTSVLNSKDADEDDRAQAMYRIGICDYGQSDYDKALSTLRQLTVKYPWSVYANEAYYYIGLCHFRFQRWTKAVEALKMVGTSVPPSHEKITLTEADQRYLVKVSDKDLRVLSVLGTNFVVTVKTATGDTETLPMEIFDKEGETYMGSLQTESGAPVPDDGILQFQGRDTFRAVYEDANSVSGAQSQKRLAVSRVVSTAAIGFMDGAYREYVHGVFAGQRSFLRVKDFDADTTAAPDRVRVRVFSQYEETSEDAEDSLAISEDAEDSLAISEDTAKVKVRAETSAVLTETGPHTGLFTSDLTIQLVGTPGTALVAEEGDLVIMEYTDVEHIAALDAPRKVTSRAEFLTGEIPDVWVAHREVDTIELKARKNVLEAQFYLRLAQIFGEVGLQDRAEQKADIGLEKVDVVLRDELKTSISRELVEDAYRTKWELMLAKGDLDGAIRTCQTLMSLYPTSALTDVALLNIAKANLAAGKGSDALRILNAIAGLSAAPELKAEALFMKAEVQEQSAETTDAMGPAIASFKQCADMYPNSPFAGHALEKVIDFHLEARDYQRCTELLETCFVDFPDASFLDTMLLKWGVTLARMQQYEEASVKLRQLLREYPNSNSAGKAQKFLEVVNKKMRQ